MNDDIEYNQDYFEKIAYSDNIYYSPYDLAEAQKCLSGLNDYVNTPGYGQLTKDSKNFINDNKFYKKSDSRKALDEDMNYSSYNAWGADGRQKDLLDSADDALDTLNSTIRGIAQMDKTVQKYFPTVVEQKIVGPFELAVDNFADGAVIDSVNGTIAALNEIRRLNGKLPMAYSDRLAAGEKLSPGNDILETTIATVFYATGSSLTESTLNAIPVVGKSLSLLHAETQGIGVGISYALKDDGMVSRKETDASIIVGSILGPVFWGGGNSVQGLMPAVKL